MQILHEMVFPGSVLCYRGLITTYYVVVETDTDREQSRAFAGCNNEINEKV